MNRDLFSSQFPLGVQLERQPAPELKREMQLLQNNGFNRIGLTVDWTAVEPLEGRLDFAPFEELIEHAAGLKMGVSIGLNCDEAPGWLYGKYPECCRRDDCPTLCFDHPGMMSDHLRFIRALAERLGRFQNVAAWNLRQETPAECRCEHSLAAFHAWLESKYGGLDGLNRAWNAHYAGWEFIHPERGVSLAQKIDWGYFSGSVRPAGWLHARVEAIKAADLLQRPVFAHNSQSSPSRGADWAPAAACLPAQAPFHAWDDASPKRGQPPERTATLLNETAALALTFDRLRLPDAPLWADGLQGGPVGDFLQPGREPSREDIRRWMLSAAASGVTGITFSGLTGSSPRLQEAARVGAALNRHADLFTAPAWGGADVAILVNEENAQFCSAAAPEAALAAHLEYSTRGWHRLLWELGIPVDFVNTQDVRGEMNPAYKALILPFPLSLSEANAEKLGEYVYTGGALISEAAPGRFDEHGFANPGGLSPILSNLFGVRQASFAMVREPGATQRWMPGERGWGEFLEPGALDGAGPLDEQILRASLYVQTFECQGSQPVLKYKSRAAGTFRVGVRGMAWLIGTCVGHNALAYRGPETPVFVRQLLELCQVRPSNRGHLLLRKRRSGGKQAWFFNNPTAGPVTETIDVGEASVEDLLGEGFERSGSRVTLSVAGLDVRVLIVS